MNVASLCLLLYQTTLAAQKPCCLSGALIASPHKPYSLPELRLPQFTPHRQSQTVHTRAPYASLRSAHQSAVFLVLEAAPHGQSC